MTKDAIVKELKLLREDLFDESLPKFDVIEMLEKGVENYDETRRLFDFDLETKTLTVNSDFRIKIKGDLYIEAEKHIMINSGETIDPRRTDGLEYSIFFNSKKDIKYGKVSYIK